MHLINPVYPPQTSLVTGDPLTARWRIKNRPATGKGHRERPIVTRRPSGDLKQPAGGTAQTTRHQEALAYTPALCIRQSVRLHERYRFLSVLRGRSVRSRPELEAEVQRLVERRDAARVALESASHEAWYPVEACLPAVFAAADAEVVATAKKLKVKVARLAKEAEALRRPLAAHSWAQRPTVSLADGVASGVEADLAAVLITLDRLAEPLEAANV